MAHPKFILERNRRFSDSLLWRLQRNFFDRRGARAWTEAVVPHYITSNPWIANAYAQVVFGWLRDWYTGPSKATGSAVGGKSDQPFFIVELGCGSGRFAYLFLVRFFDLLSRSHLAALPVRSVLTDFTDYNLDILRNHPKLRPFVEAGRLDFARYDAGEDVDLELGHRGEILAPGSVARPLAVLANYVFDGIPQDCFTFRDGRLYESLATLSSRRRETDLDDPELLTRIEIDWQHREASPHYYGDSQLDRLLGEYVDSLEETTILFPSSALRCIRNLRHLSGGRLLLLSADKGYSDQAALVGRGEPGISVHGSFSTMVNYHAIGRWFLHRGGNFLVTSYRSESLNVSAGLLGRPPAGWVETRLAFDDAIERLGPDDFFSVKKGIETSYEAFSLEQLLAWLRLSAWDHNIFLGCLPVLTERVVQAPEELRQEVVAAARRVWELYFPLREPRDLAFDLGLLVMAMGRWNAGLEYLGHSVRTYGEDPATAFNMALCHRGLGDEEAALEQLERALDLDPELEEARSLRSAMLAAGGGEE